MRARPRGLAYVRIRPRAGLLHADDLISRWLHSAGEGTETQRLTQKQPQVTELESDREPASNFR